jgi:hypothetical protein
LSWVSVFVDRLRIPSSLAFRAVFAVFNCHCERLRSSKLPCDIIEFSGGRSFVEVHLHLSLFPLPPLFFLNSALEPLFLLLQPRQTHGTLVSSLDLCTILSRLKSVSTVNSYSVKATIVVIRLAHSDLPFGGCLDEGIDIFLFRNLRKLVEDLLGSDYRGRETR